MYLRVQTQAGWLHCQAALPVGIAGTGVGTVTVVPTGREHFPRHWCIWSPLSLLPAVTASNEHIKSDFLLPSPNSHAAMVTVLNLCTSWVNVLLSGMRFCVMHRCALVTPGPVIATSAVEPRVFAASIVSLALVLTRSMLTVPAFS